MLNLLALALTPNIANIGVAVGNSLFVETVQSQLGDKAKGRQCHNEGEHCVLREAGVAYTPFLSPNKGGFKRLK